MISRNHKKLLALTLYRYTHAYVAIIMLYIFYYYVVPRSTEKAKRHDGSSVNLKGLLLLHNISIGKIITFLTH